MPRTDDGNTAGRRANDAQPLGKRDGLVPERKRRQIAAEEQRSAGPDGPSAKAVGDTFKKKPPR
jgi:hypothetical protein